MDCLRSWGDGVNTRYFSTSRFCDDAERMDGPQKIEWPKRDNISLEKVGCFEAENLRIEYIEW